MSKLINGLSGNLPSTLNTLAALKEPNGGWGLPIGYPTGEVRGRIVGAFSPAGAVTQRSGIPAVQKGRLRVGVTIDSTDVDGREVSSGASVTYDVNKRSDNAKADGFVALKALKTSVSSWTDAQIKEMVERSLDVMDNIVDTSASDGLHNVVVAMTAIVSQP